MSLFLKSPLNKINVLIIIDSLDGGGAESQVLMLASGLVEQGLKVSIFVLRGGGELTQKALDLNLCIIEGRFESKRNLKSFFLGFLKLCKVIKKQKIAIVHSFLPLSNFLGSVAGKISGAKLIITSRRGLIKLNYLKKRWRLLDNISNYCSNIITVNSNAIRDEIEKIDYSYINKIICIHNGLDIKKFNFNDSVRNEIRQSLNLNESDFAWIKVANFSAIKGHADLIRAFAKIDSKYSTKLFLIGKDNGSLEELKELVQTLRVQNRIKFLGFQNDVPKILSAMDGYICASHTEGFSNAILEAMASQLPIIATSVGGNPEILLNGKYGLLVNPSDQDGMHNSIINLMTNKPLQEKFKVLSYEQIKENYSKESMINNYIGLYKRVLD